MSIKRTPLYREDDHELLGYVVSDGAGWWAETLFGYLIVRTAGRQEAEKVLRKEGPSYLTGVWHYFDTDDNQWYPCVIKEAQEQRVTVIRTNAMGYQNSQEYKMITISEVDETKLVKAS